MQRRAVLLSSFWLFVLLIGCGGGGKSTKPVATTIKITPTSLSLESGKFMQLAATVLDQGGNVMTGETVTWSSNNTAIADVSTNSGAVCGGKWDSVTAPTVCTAGPNGAAEITATHASGISAKVAVTVFPHVSRVVVAPMSGVCVSSGQTMQFNATAFDSANNPISTTPASFAWSSSDSSIAAIDVNGVVTGKRPGSATISASLTNTQGLSQTVLTCPPASITLASTGVTPPETAFSLTSGGTKGLTATVTDIKGNPITDIVLTYSSSNAVIATVSGSGLTANVGASVGGVTTIVASCIPFSCNSGPNQAYLSNPVTVTVPGPTTPKVLVAGTTANGVVVIDNGTPGTQIALPTINSATPVPNSIVMAPNGNTAYIGTNLGLLRFDLASSTFQSSIPTPSDSFVIGVSPNSATVLTSDRAGTVYVIDANTGATAAILAPGIVSASFSADNLKALLASASGLHVFDGLGKQVLPTGTGAATQAVFLPQSSVALTSNGGTGTLVANCNYSTVDNPGTVGTLLSVGNTSSRFWGANGSNIFQVEVAGSYSASSTSSTIDCKPQLTATPTAISLGASVTPKQLIAVPNNSKALLLANSSTLYLATAGSSSIAPVALTGGGTALAGDVTTDSGSIFVGASTNDVHRIDVNGANDAQQIAVGLKKADGTAAAPNLIAVRPK